MEAGVFRTMHGFSSMYYRLICEARLQLRWIETRKVSGNGIEGSVLQEGGDSEIARNGNEIHMCKSIHLGME